MTIDEKLYLITLMAEKAIEKKIS